MMLLITATLLAAAAAFPFEITPLPVFPVPDPTPAEPCGMATRVCMDGSDCASGFCNRMYGATTGCCQDTQWPVPGPEPTPPPFEPVCPVNIPLCVTDMDCGFSGYCNHTEAHHNFFGCCQFGPAPSDGPAPFPFPVTVPAPSGEICPAWITVCITDSDCSPGDSCSHLASNSDVFGCCHAGMEVSVGPVVPSDGPFPFPFPFPVTVPAPAAEICPAWITVCITDSDCSPGDSCSHLASQSDVFGCCHAGIVDPTVAPFPFPFPDPVPTPVAPFAPPAGEQPRCAIELSCLADADCATFSGRCEFVFGSPMGCCTPNL